MYIIKNELSFLIDNIKYLPDDIKIYILRFLSPSKLVFINKFFYIKYHQIYLINQYNNDFASKEANKFTLLERIIPYIERNVIMKNINIHENFRFSNTFIKILINSIKSNYCFLLYTLLHDGELILYKIEEQMRSNDHFCKWLKLSHKGTDVIYYNSLYAYIKYLCRMYKPTKDILRLLELYYFNKYGNNNNIYDNYIIQKQNLIQTIPAIIFNNYINENNEELIKENNISNNIISNNNIYNVIDNDIDNNKHLNGLKQTHKRKDRKRIKNERKEMQKNTKKHKTKAKEWGNI